MRKRFALGLVALLGLSLLVLTAPASARQIPPVTYTRSGGGLVRDYMQLFPHHAEPSYCHQEQKYVSQYSLGVKVWTFHENFQYCYHYIDLYRIHIDSFEDGTWASDVNAFWHYDGIVGSYNSGGVGRMMAKVYRQGEFCSSFHTPVCVYPWIWQQFRGDYSTHGPRYWWDSGK